MDAVGHDPVAFRQEVAGVDVEASRVALEEVGDVVEVRTRPGADEGGGAGRRLTPRTNSAALVAPRYRKLPPLRLARSSSQGLLCFDERGDVINGPAVKPLARAEG
jgi:hypothetical protein